MREFFKAPERRFRVLWVSPELMANAVVNLGCQFVQEYVTEGLPEGLPEGTTVQSVTYDYIRDAFGFRVYHESFDVVPDCEFPPELLVTMRVVDRGENSAPAIVQRGREFI